RQRSSTTLHPRALLEWSLLVLRLHTGRTHQIRAHCAQLGHPLAADQAYGGRKLEVCQRVFLHAFQLRLATPGAQGGSDGFTADAFSPLPEDLHEVLREMNAQTAECA
ncbi:rluD, partial [Symbiodinium pilosum]